MLLVFKQDPKHIDQNNRAQLVNLAPTKALQDALDELVSSGLVKKDNLNYSIHRVVQEAVSYVDDDDLQVSFNTACRLVYEQFPKTDGDSQLFGNWTVCAEYIAHGVYLSKKFVDLVRSGRVKGSRPFVKLLSNCSQYLYESGDFATTEKVLESAHLACDDKNSLLFANLRNLSGARSFDLNRLADCRKAWGDALKIRKALLPGDAAQGMFFLLPWNTVL